MKTKVLQALRAQNGYISGQALSEALGVSRTAVWKKIRQLQEEGYEIEAVPNRGYRIVGCPDLLAKEEVQSRMNTWWIGRQAEYFSQIDSTNQYAKRAAEEGAAEGLLVIADEQTKGRGRSGHTWTTPPGTAIAMTLLLRPRIAPEKISMVTLITGLAVAQACRSLYGVDAGIKWPNDVVIGGRKLCGTLTEMTTDMHSVSYIVIGTGINVNIRSFPEDLKDTATSLYLELGREVSRAELIAEVMKNFEEAYLPFLEAGSLAGILEEYNGMLVNKDRAVRVLQPSDSFSGTALGINELGELLVKREDGAVVNVYAGEVSVRGIYGYV